MSIVGFNPRHNYDVRVVADDGAQLGIHSLQNAIRMASDKGLDLINISPQAKPPVAKIMDYGKFKYKQKQIEKEAKKKQNTVQLKEIKFGANIEDHDLQVKVAKVKECLAEGDRVKICIRFHGREMAHQDLGVDLLKSIVDSIKELCSIETQLTSERREIFVIVKPKNEKKS